ncbi:MAG: right-handed parallel beta-helix repeat-containing protein, partial [Planctomycetota bacterium]
MESTTSAAARQLTIARSSATGPFIITNCEFTENAVTGIDNCSGGAIHCSDNSNATFINCKFTRNAGNDGGALFITGSTFIITGCTFSANISDAAGGAIYCGYNTTLTITNSMFYGNSAVSGGGLHCSYGNATVTNCTFIANSAGGGGAVMDYFSYSLKLVNCTIAANTAGYYGGGMRTTSANVFLSNCILWANSDGGGMDESAQVHTQKQIQVRYCCIQNWTQGGMGNINLDPMFAHNPDIGGENYDFGNLHLRTGSPCIDAADNNSVPVDVLTDLDGLNRFYDDTFTPDTGYTDGNKPVVDMGAYEYSQSTPYWKNHIVFPSEPFQAYGTSANDPSWVKFTIFINDPGIIYFQDSQEYVFHYDFATNRLVFFLGTTPQQFYELTLYEENQQAVLGTVIMPPMENFAPIPTFQEYGIQFHRHDPYPKEQIADLFDTVKSCIVTDPNVRAFYFPSYEQLPAAEANRQWFESNGIPISSTSRWYQANVSYSDGWALGKLKYFEGKDIQPAYQNGLLEPNDILLTDGVPAEIPFVAGIITLSPTTPNSHVAILARTFGVPFVHLALAQDAQKAQQLLGNTVFLNTSSAADSAEVLLLDIEGSLTSEELEEILALKTPPDLDISPMAHYGAYSTSTEGLLPVDTKYFGGKAANFGMLRAAIPDKSPVAAALSLDLWNEFL